MRDNIIHSPETCAVLRCLPDHGVVTSGVAPGSRRAKRYVSRTKHTWDSFTGRCAVCGIDERTCTAAVRHVYMARWLTREKNQGGGSP